jgi:hypothetical protein
MIMVILDTSIIIKIINTNTFTWVQICILKTMLNNGENYKFFKICFYPDILKLC